MAVKYNVFGEKRKKETVNRELCKMRIYIKTTLSGEDVLEIS